MLRVKTGTCPFCQRNSSLTFHHLIPKKLHRREYYKKHYTREQINKGVNICRKCHSGIHDIFDEKTLARQFNNLEALQSDETLAKHFSWVGKQRIKAE